jgi:hypothetical protein
MIRGAGVGTAELAVIATMLLSLLVRSEEQAALFDDMIAAGTRMLAVFVPYTLVVLAALVAYAAPNFEIRCLATVVVLGPLTMARAVVLLLGAAAASWTAPPPVRVAAFATIAIVLVGEVALHRWARSIPPLGEPVAAEREALGAKGCTRR